MATLTTDTPLPSGGDALTPGQLALVTGGRLALTTAFRIIYPLQPFLAARLDIDLRTVSALVTVQLLASLVSPLGGMLADTRGERETMSGGLALFCAGALLCASSGSFWGFLAGYALIGLGVALYQPAALSYLSARTSYARRGRALGIFETSWAGAALLGVAPLMLLVQVAASAAPVYWTLLALGVGSLALVWLALPATGRREVGGRQVNWGALRSPGIAGMLGLTALAMCAYDLFLVSQAPWLKVSFGAGEAQLGQVFAVAGAAELIGSVGVVLLADRLGKKRATIAGYIGAALCLAALPLSEGSWQAVLGLTFLLYLCLEFAIVAAIPLLSGVAQAARGTAMALSTTVGGVSRSVGSLLSAPLWVSAGQGIGANALLAAALLLAGVGLAWWLVREREA